MQDTEKNNTDIVSGRNILLFNPLICASNL